jgi:uncharacterized protein YjgD (DUF1641 family)
MATRADVMDAAKVSHENALAILDKILADREVAYAREVTSNMSVDEIIRGTIGTVTTGLDALIRDLPDLSKKLTKKESLDQLLERLKTG